MTVGTSKSGIEVLLLEGDRSTRAIVSEALQRVEASSVQVLDAKAAALYLSTTCKPTIILLDCSNPHIDIIRFCREHCIGLRTYTILLSDNTPMTMLLSAMRNGADAYVDDPFCVEHIVAHLRVAHSMLSGDTKLLSAQERRKLYLQNVPWGAASLDHIGVIRFANTALKSMFLPSHREIVGCSFRELFAESPGRTELARALRRRQSFAGLEVSAIPVDGEITRTLRVTGHTPPREIACQSGCDVFIEDVTQRVRLEQCYRQGQKMEAIGTLAGGIAHDFNNLLYVMQSYAEQLSLDLRDAPEACRKLNAICEATQHAADLTRQLLAFSRRQILKAEATDINDLVLGFRSMVSRIIGEEIVLSTDLHPDVGPVLVDPSQLRQVLLNLVVNAREAMPRGGSLRIATTKIHIPRSTVVSLAQVPPGEYVSLEVTDSGCGMTADVQARIFEPFYSTKGEHGTGLGLSTCYGIVKQSNGFIWVRSAPRQGTTFEVWLPVSQPAESRVEDAPVMEEPAVTKALILLVEDEELVRRAAVDCLIALGFEVLAAGSPAQALELAQGRHIDLLLSDVVMPGMRGPELAKLLCQHRPDLKIVFMSGYAFDSGMPRKICGIAVDFLQKPFDAQTLLRVVSNALRVPGKGMPK